MTAQGEQRQRESGWIERIERLGNALPDPSTLFLLGCAAIALLAQLAIALDWSVEKRVLPSAAGGAATTAQTVEVRAVPLLDAEGLYWALSSLVANFIDFPPLGVVLVGLLGIGVAERSGLLAAAIEALLRAVPARAITPALLLLGIVSSAGIDAGYVILPPLGAALFAALGRPPLVGLAVVFAGVSAGFSANLIPTSLDMILSGFSTEAARLVAPDYQVAVTANWAFMAASSLLLTAVGWFVTARWVEPRFATLAAEDGGPPAPAETPLRTASLDATAARALRRAGLALAAGLLLVLAATLLPGAPLAGIDGNLPRWVKTLVPLIFLLFLVPGVVYGASAGTLRSDKDVARMMGETMAGMGPYLVLAFSAGQFIAWFAHSRLGEMLAVSGGRLLTQAALPEPVLLVAFIAIVMLADLLIGSMSAKYAFFAPVFVPMFLQVGISPELTQAAYRIGDSVTNVVTPLNPYMVILIVFARRYVAKAGAGTLIALMLPYALSFAVAWTLLLLLWTALGLPLGPLGPLHVAVTG